jgi:hypothetical protein
VSGTRCGDGDQGCGAAGWRKRKRERGQSEVEDDGDVRGRRGGVGCFDYVMLAIYPKQNHGASSFSSLETLLAWGWG